MDFISLILIAIRGLSVVTNNPALGGGSSVRLQEASELLDFLGELIERGDEGHEQLKAFAEMVEGMAKEGRAPSTAEWDALRARSDAAHDVIQEAAAAATSEPETEEEREKREAEEELDDLEAIPEEDRSPEEADRIEELLSKLES